MEGYIQGEHGVEVHHAAHEQCGQLALHYGAK